MTRRDSPRWEPKKTFRLDDQTWEEFGHLFPKRRSENLRRYIAWRNAYPEASFPWDEPRESAP